MFNEKIGVSYIFKAGKPGKNGYEQAMRKIGLTKKRRFSLVISYLRMSGEPKEWVPQHPCEADQPKRGDTDRIKTTIGMDYSLFL